jgi:GNAT superfamily N-acetyltransferase
VTAPVRERPLVRPATTADLPAIAAILAANDEPIEWPGLPGWPYLEHLLAHSRVLVAELEGSVAGFGGTVGPRAPRGGTFLTDLFVRPDLHGRGIGGALLAALFPRAGPRATFASSDPRALPLYIRFGMLPRWPNLYLSGESAALPVIGGVDVELAGDASTVARHYRELAGHDRQADLAYWRSLPGGTGIIATADRRVVAAGSGRDRRTGPGRWLDRLVLAPGADPLVVIPEVLRAVGGGSLVALAIAGPNPVVRLMLDAGFRILEQDVFCSTDPPLLDPDREVADASLF